jgi:hypothetical protein
MVRAVCGGGWAQTLWKAVVDRDVSALLQALITPGPKPQTAMVAYVPTPTPSSRGREVCAVVECCNYKLWCLVLIINRRHKSARDCPTLCRRHHVWGGLRTQVCLRMCVPAHG